MYENTQEIASRVVKGGIRKSYGLERATIPRKLCPRNRECIPYRLGNIPEYSRCRSRGKREP